MMQYEGALDYAWAEGTNDGKAAASWYFDGNTTEETYRTVLAGLDDGDPEVLDSLPAPDLSGEQAGVRTGPELVTEALDHADVPNHVDEEDGVWSFDDICQAYEEAFYSAVVVEVGRLARDQLGL